MTCHLRTCSGRSLTGSTLVVLVCAALLGFAGEASAHGRTMTFERLGSDAGLSQSTVLAVHQDRRGFLWVGTEDGLNRYDGYGFTTYYQDAEEPGALRSDWIWSVVEDEGGDLWIATEGGGLARWRATDERFETFAHDDGTPKSLASDDLRALALGPDGRLWVATRDAGLDRFDPKTGVAEHFRHDPADPSSLAHDSVYAVRLDRAGILWVGTDSGLQRFVPKTGRFETVEALAALGLAAPPKVRSLLEDAEGRLWIGTSATGLIRIDKTRSTAELFAPRPDDPHSLPGERVLALLEDSGGRVWAGTSKGLGLWDDRSGGFFAFRSDAGDSRSLGGDDVMSLYQDRGGVLWVGTRTAGLSKWNPASWQFGHVTVTPSHGGGLSERNVTAFSEGPRGRLWVGTFGGGIDVIDRGTGEIAHLNPADGRGLGSSRISSLAQDIGGATWVGTFDAGLFRYDPATGRFESFRHDPARPTSISSDAVTSILVDSSGAVWAGTYGEGLNKFDRRDSSFRRFAGGEGGPLTSGKVTALAEHVNGSIWVGTEGGGLDLLHSRTGEVVALRSERGRVDSLPVDSITAVHVDPAGTVWVGTRGGGLSRLESLPGPKGPGRFRNYSKRQGLPNDMVYGIRSDRAGTLWISTNEGLSRFDPEAERFTNYDVGHGLQAQEFHFGSHFQNSRGELFFGGINGFNAFQPDRLRTAGGAPPVVLTSFLKLNRPVADAGPVSSLTEVDLDYRDDVVTFEFAALDFVDSSRNRYRYMLEGLNAGWIDLGSHHRVTFTDLDAGDYVLRVQAANADGVWNEDGLALAMSVGAPPWATPWAYIAYVMMACGAALGWVQIDRRKLEREEQYSRELEKEVASRTAELSTRATELEHLNRRLAEASLTDSLTGMANRRFVFEYLDKEVALVQRRHSAMRSGRLTVESMNLAFLMLDLDHFKTVNDTWGHLVGDEVLKQMRPVLEDACRSSDILIRWGGDEFLVVGREADPEAVANLAERIRERVANHPFHIGEGRVVHTSCSIGFACYPFSDGQGPDVAWEQVIALADQALYTAKRSSRNRWVGLLSTPTTPGDGLLNDVREDLPGLVERGELAARTSAGDAEDLVWD